MSDYNSYKTFFNKLHNILRNGEAALTGMAALNEINNFILLVFIEKNINIYFNNDDTKTLKFSYLIKEYFSNNKQSETDYIEDLHDAFENIIIKYCENEKLKKYLLSDANKLSIFVGINNEDEEETERFMGLCQQLNDIIKVCHEFFFNSQEINDTLIENTFNNIDFDLLGDAYENFKEEEVGNQGKKLGQYFTPRDIIRFCITKHIKPKYNDFCYDSSCGTGGFIHYLDKYVRDNDSNKSHISIFKNNIYGNDKTSDVIKPLNINLLLHNIDIDNIKHKNSLSYTNCDLYFEYFDNCVGNPPYGVKNKIKYDDFNDFKKLKYNYWPKFMKTGKELIKDSMGQFMIHVINSLKINGVFSLVIDRGILNNGTENNSWEKNLRKWLLTCCDVKQIVLLPKGIFSSTNFDTAIIYGIKKISFEDMNKNMMNNYSTKSFKFFVGDFVDKKNKKGLLVKDECDLVINIEDFIKNHGSLKYDDYIEKEDVSYDGIEYKCLGDVCEFNIGSTPSTKNSEYYNNGKYLWCSISDLNNGYIYDTKKKLSQKAIEETAVRLIKKDSLLMSFKLTIGKLGYASTDMYCNEAIAFFNNYKGITKEYLYYTLKLLNYSKQKHLMNSQISNALNKSTLGKLKIPILSPEHQERIVKFMDNIIGDNYSLLDRLVSDFKDLDLFKFLIVEDYDTFGLAIEYINKLSKFETETVEFNRLRKKACFKTVKSEVKTLGDVCEIKQGEFISKKDTGTLYNVWGGGIKSSQKCNKFNFENKIVLTRVGTGLKNDFKNSCVKFINEKFFLTDNAFSIINIKDINEKYLYNYLNISQNKWKILAGGQAQPVMSKTKLQSIKIPVPSLEDQEKVVKMIEAIEKEDSEYNKMLLSIKDMIQTIYDSIALITDTSENTNVVENETDVQHNVQHDVSSESSEDEHIFPYKGNEYYLEDGILYKLKNGKKGKRYGLYKNGKVKKDKKPKNSVEV